MIEILRGLMFLACLLAPGMALGLWLGWRLRGRADQVGWPLALVPAPALRLWDYIIAQIDSVEDVDDEPV